MPRKPALDATRPLSCDEIKAQILSNARKTGKSAFPVTEMSVRMVEAAIR